MPAGSLSRFFQSPLNAALFERCPPLVSRCYVRMLGELWFARHPGERGRCREGLERVLGERMRGGRGRGIERAVLRGVADHYFEKMLSAYWGYERVRRFLLRRLRLVHGGLLDGALAEGRGVILTTGHFGAVEFLPGSLAWRGYPVSMVVRYKTRRLKAAMEEIARRAGVEAIDADEGDVLARALSAIRRGRVFITELDEFDSWRPAPRKVMTFFGRRLPLDRAVELLQRRTGAPVLLALIERVGALRYELVLEPPAEHQAAPVGLGPDAQLLKRFEHYVYERPDHWYQWNEVAGLGRLEAA